VTALRWILHLVAIAAIALAGLVLYDTHRALRDTAGQARYTLDNVNRLVRETAQTSANLRHATAEWETSSKQQAAYFTAAAAKTGAVLDAAQSAIASIERSSAQINAAIINQDANLQAIERQATAAIATLEKTAAGLEPVIADLAKTAGNTATVTADPSIAETLRHVDGTAGQFELTSQHIEGATKDIQAFVHRETSPVRGTWNMIRSFLATFAGPAAQVATAAK
jgi:ABC-type transporter Mla subunit MlaD